ncbi:unnamed protein product [Miscanthus lutarioriparius]|uniref:Uncharacterized protein n=1 Tax=Miscanthus lutarioriparius TaxID=422564 RepID=A0A811SJW4_9POAL|nr:unnamed protein product [Miscanthus lutarioriparius]
MVLTKLRDRRARLARLRLPMRLRCDACSLHLDKGTMFVAFKEDLTEGKRHIGAVKIFRFYFKCIHCSAEIAFKTDPAN